MRQDATDSRRRKSATTAGRLILLVPALLFAAGGAGAQEAPPGTAHPITLSAYLKLVFESGPAAESLRQDEQRLALDQALQAASSAPRLTLTGAGSSPGPHSANRTPPPVAGRVTLSLSRGGSGGTAGPSGSSGPAASGTSAEPAWSLEASLGWDARLEPVIRWESAPVLLSLTYTRSLWPPATPQPSSAPAWHVKLAAARVRIPNEGVSRFFELQDALAAYQLARRGTQLARQRFEASQARFSAGAIGMPDLIRSQDALSAAESEAAETRRRLQEAGVAFFRAAGMTLPGAGASSSILSETLFSDLVDDGRWAEVAEAVAKAIGLSASDALFSYSAWEAVDLGTMQGSWLPRLLAASPEVAEARLAVERAEAALAAARSAAGPGLSLTLRASFAVKPGEGVDPSATLSLVQPLWAPTAPLRVKEAEHALEAARSALESATTAATDAFLQQWWALGQAVSRYASARTALDRAERTVQTARARREEGLGTLLDEQEAVLSHDRARASLVVAEHRQRLIWLEIAALLGLDLRPHLLKPCS